MITDIFDRGIQNFRGTRDYFGNDARQRLWVIEQIRQSFELFGFEPLETPAIENERTLKGKYGDEGEKKRFRLSLPFPQEGGLRYDQTVPLARFMSMNWNRFPLPYRRYVIGPVWRDESGAGRLRQFTQCDFDTVGSTSSIIDAEIVAINYTVLSKLGFGNVYQIKLNDRRLLDAIARYLKVESRDLTNAIFRAWDKLEKADRATIRKELKEDGADRNLIRRFERATDKLQETTSMSNEDTITFLNRAFPVVWVSGALANIYRLIADVSNMGVPDEAYKFYPLLARGLDYYTGPIFETTVDVQGVGSITGGGRFDKLISDMGGPDLPASGSSFGLERVMEVMTQLGLSPQSNQNTQVFLTIFNQDNQELCGQTFKVASKLRLDNIPVEIYTGSKSKLGSQFDIARRKSIPLVVVIGPDELTNNTVTLKDMRSGNQQTINISDLSAKVKEILSQ